MRSTPKCPQKIPGCTRFRNLVLTGANRSDADGKLDYLGARSPTSGSAMYSLPVPLKGIPNRGPSSANCFNRRIVGSEFWVSFTSSSSPLVKGYTLKTCSKAHRLESSESVPTTGTDSYSDSCTGGRDKKSALPCLFPARCSI